MEEVAIIADPKGEGFYFARGVFNYLKEKGSRTFGLKEIPLEVVDFRDGEFKVRIEENIRRKNCFFIHDSNKNPARWFTELAFTLDAMQFSSPREVNLVLPYTRFARQDRKDESRVGVNAKCLADLISRYKIRGMTVDLHVPQMQQYFDIPFDNLYSFPSLISYLKSNHPEMLKEPTIVSPDVGGGGRVKAFVRRLLKAGIPAEFAIGDKTRARPGEIENCVIIGNVEGRDCLLLDDIIDSGNTIIKTADALRKKGAKRVYAYGTHGLYTAGVERFGMLDKMMSSDTLKPKIAENFEVVSLIPLFGEAIYRTIRGESLSELFDGKA